MDTDNKFIIYQTEDGQTQIDVRLESETVWLTQAQMAELFETDRTSIVRHINNIYKVEELDRESTCAKIAQVQVEGKRNVKRNIPYFTMKLHVFPPPYEFCEKICTSALSAKQLEYQAITLLCRFVQM